MTNYQPSSELHVASEQACNNEQRYAVWEQKKRDIAQAILLKTKQSDATRTHSHGKRLQHA